MCCELWEVDSLTNNETHFTFRVLIAAGHHGAYRVVHHRHKTQIKFLKTATSTWCYSSYRSGNIWTVLDSALIIML